MKYYLVFLHTTNEYMIYSLAMLSFVISISPAFSVEIVHEGTREACEGAKASIIQSMESVDVEYFEICAN